MLPGSLMTALQGLLGTIVLHCTLHIAVNGYKTIEDNCSTLWRPA